MRGFPSPPLIEEPESVFLGHTVPYSGHGVSIAVALFKYLKKRGWEKDVIVVGSDGTNTLVGHMQGAIAYLEKLLGHPVQWSICLIHGNELPFCGLFQLHDGKTSGPNSFKGPLGKQLEDNLTKFPPVKFARIKNKDFPNIPVDVVDDLSTDQRYLYRICCAIQEGQLENGLADCQPGPLNMARWLTLANRIARLYVATANPSNALKRLTFVLTNFYAPSYFYIKSHPLMVQDPFNLHKMIEFSRKLTKNKKLPKRQFKGMGFMPILRMS